MNPDQRTSGAQSQRLWVAIACVLFTLNLTAMPLASAAEGGRFDVLPVENPRYCGNELFRAFENYYSPRVCQLRARYGLDAVVADENDEWRRILLLRHWIKSTIAIDNHNPTKTRGDTFAILDAALKGGKFHCTHFSIVQHAVLNSFGYVTRRLGCGPGRKDDGGHHGVNEVWVNKFSKWVLIDAKYDAHFEKDGVPLSALEIRDEVWRDGGQSVVRVVGPDRRPMTSDPETGKWETRPDTYRWCGWETSTNRFTTFPAKSTSTLIMLDDDIFKSNVWYRDGKPHWAYGTPYMILTSRRDWIEWTPNVITSKVTIEDSKARLFLGSCTPNFRSFQEKGDDGTWNDCGEEMELPLAESARNRFTFRTISLFGVTGPEHRVEIVNIANEQNSRGWQDTVDVFDFRNPTTIIELCEIVHQQDPDRLVGGGGYDHAKNETIGMSSHVDVLLFDTVGREDSGPLYDRFVTVGVTDKPIVNVELFGSWSENSAKGVFSNSKQREYCDEIDAVKTRGGLSVFFHASTWCQKSPLRYDLAGEGTSDDPGIHWYFDYVARKRGIDPMVQHAVNSEE